MNKTTGRVCISFEYSRHLGPSYIHGAVRPHYDAARPYSFSSYAKWPEKENFEPAVQESVEAVPQERRGSLEHVEVVLESITFDPVSSCELGFRKAARAATEADGEGRPSFLSFPEARDITPLIFTLWRYDDTPH